MSVCLSCGEDIGLHGHDWKCIHATRPPTHVDVSSVATKFDDAKPTPQFIAPEMIFGLSEVLAYGAKKYAPRNWEKGMAWSRPFGGLMRHMWAWWSGEGKDPETGFSHLHHAACCLMFLIAYEKRKIGEDDRD